MKIFSFLIFSLLLSTAIAQTDTIRFALHWQPQAQFAGYYMAIEKGFYAENELTVELIHTGINNTAEDLLAEGKVDMASLFLSTALSCYEEGTSLRNLAQLSQRSALMFVAKKESGIDSLSDFNGKKIGIWKSGFEEIPHAFFRQNELLVQTVPILYTVNLFLKDGIDIMTVMWYNEYHEIVNAGFNQDELNTFFLADYNINIPEDGIYCLQSYMDVSNEAVIRNFIDATLKGWEYAFNNAEETIAVVLTYMKENNRSADLPHQRWMLEKIKDSFLQDTGSKFPYESFGRLNEKTYNNAAGILQRNGLLTRYPRYQELFIPVE